MKRFCAVMLSLGFCALYGDQLPTTLQQLSQIPIDVKQLSAVLKQAPEISNFFRSLHQDDFAKNLDLALKPIAQIGQLLEGYDVLKGDFLGAVKAGQNIPKIVVCAKASAAVRQGDSANAKVCQQIGCVDRAQCIKSGIAEVRALLKPFIQDIFIGYTVNGKPEQGLLLTGFDMVQQPQLKKEIAPVITVLTEILKFIDAIDNMIIVEPARGKS